MIFQSFQTEGVLAASSWFKPDTVKYSGTFATGRAVYRAECLRIHEIEGYNAMVPLVREWAQAIDHVGALDHLDRIKNFMPPFVGTEEEKQALGGLSAS